MPSTAPPSYASASSSAATNSARNAANGRGGATTSKTGAAKRRARASSASRASTSRGGKAASLFYHRPGTHKPPFIELHLQRKGANAAANDSTSAASDAANDDPFGGLGLYLTMPRETTVRQVRQYVARRHEPPLELAEVRLHLLQSRALKLEDSVTVAAVEDMWTSRGPARCQFERLPK